MLIKSYFKISDQLKAVLAHATSKHQISKVEQSEILRKIETTSFKIQDMHFCDVRFLPEYKTIILPFSKKYKIEINNLDGWRAYDEMLWLYQPSSGRNRDEAKILEHPKLWFDIKRVEVKKSGGKCISKRMLFVKYPQEIEEILRYNKNIYFIKQVFEKTIKHTKDAITFTFEEIAEFEKIIYIKNKKSGTRLYYGVWDI